MSFDLFTETAKLRVSLKKVCEIGVYYPESCSLKKYIDAGIETLLVEADPLCVEKIKQIYGSNPKVRIFQNAVWDERTRLSFYRANASTFASAVENSPATVNDHYRPNESDRFDVDSILFGDIDPGDLDLVMIDVEGAEWNVLKTMRSRPKVISVEMQAGMYTNPNREKIEAWLRENGYELWMINDTDWVYALRQTLQLSAPARIRYRLINGINGFQQRLKGFRRRLRSRIQQVSS